jgi:hypothetical protein
MKAILIDPADRSLTVVDVRGREDIARLIGFDTVESDAVGSSGDRLHFDEECFLRGTGGRFQVDSLVPISGRAVVTGASVDGTTLRDVATDVETLRGRIKYL